MSSAGGDRRDERTRDVDHLTPQFLIGNSKHHIKNISRTEGAMGGEIKQCRREWENKENNRKIEVGPSERFQQDYKWWLEQLSTL
jgi:hypothetical protein